MVLMAEGNRLMGRKPRLGLAVRPHRRPGPGTRAGEETLRHAPRPVAPPAPMEKAADRADWLFAGGAVAAGAVVEWLSHHLPAHLPFFLPWEFSWLAFLGTALPLWWFFRGFARLPRAQRPGGWRIAAFLAGMALIYGVLQTRFLYLAEHMFFINRLQHLAMHHLGPFLIALGAPGTAILRGMPKEIAALTRLRPVTQVIGALQHPVVAPILFVGLFALWLVPPLHFVAMLDPRLFWVMNWSMVLDGILFWWLVLDPRPRPPARTSYGVRVLLALSVIVPQIALGAFIYFTSRDLYPYYSFCGRAFTDMGAGTDQRIGGIVTWIPTAMMSAIGVLLVLNGMRLHEEGAKERDEGAEDGIAAQTRP